MAAAPPGPPGPMGPAGGQWAPQTLASPAARPPAPPPPSVPTIKRGPVVVDNSQRRRKRPTDRCLPRRIEHYVPESALYIQMQEFEKRIDATIARKTLDVQDAISKAPKRVVRTLRVFLSNLAVNQEDGDVDTSGGAVRVPGWTLRIEGRLLDAPNTRKQPAYQPKFTSFIKSMIVKLDRDPDLYPDGSNIIEWRKEPNHQELDGVEIKRQGDTDVPVRILLYLDNNPEKHKLSTPLASLLDMSYDTMPNIIHALWQYVKLNHLQDTEDRRFINCDTHLRKIFGEPKLMFTLLPEKLNPHLHPCDPIELDYTIRVDTSFHANPHAFDIDIDLDDPIRDRYRPAITPTPAIAREIAVIDDKIAAMAQRVSDLNLRRDFLIAFSKDPVGFLKQWMASQSRDLETLLGDTYINEEETRRAEFYEHEAVREALFHYLRQKDSL